MEPEDLFIDESMYESTQSNQKKERIYQTIATGKSKAYLGKEMTIEQAQALTPEEVDTYYTRHQASLGSKMGRSIGKSLVNLYVKVFGYFFKVDDSDLLADDLVSDPIVGNSLGAFACDLYYKFGSLLGPFAVALISANHINFSLLKNDGERSAEERSAEERSAEERSAEERSDEERSDEETWQSRVG